MKVAVTGGSGVVGSAVLRHLVEAGHDVAALARSAGSVATVTSSGARPVEGDILDTASLRRLMSGSELVFHVAGVNEMCLRDTGRMWRVNVEGTRAVMTACRAEGVGRLVHTSSAVTIGERKGEVGSEESPHRGFFLSQYERTKTEAERIVLAGADGLDVVSVNPSSVQGPGRATGTGRILLAAARGNLPLLVDTTISLVDVDDCARGHLLAGRRGRNGERYLLSGAVVDMRSALRLLSEALSRPMSARYLRPAAARGMATAVEGVFRLLGRQPPVCRESMRVMLHGHRYDGSKATRQLGLDYTPVEKTIKRTVEWFDEMGLLKL